MSWMKKIKNIIYEMDKKDWWLVIFVTFSIFDSIQILQYSHKLNQCKVDFKEYKETYRANLINELCNIGQGNYDFCILKKAEYTFVEKDKNPSIIPDKKNKQIEALINKTDTINKEENKQDVR